MSRTLNLIDILLTTGRHLFTMGRCNEALVPLTRLSEFRNLPEQAFEELQVLLADVYSQQGRFRDARRHLAAVLMLRPLEAEYHYRMAVAIEQDDEADRNRAEMYYAHAVKIEPDQPAWWADYGAYLFTIGKDRAGLAAIRKAYALGSDDAEIVSQVAHVLRREEHYEEATTKLRIALFQSRGGQRFRQLWQEHQFQMMVAERRKKERGKAGKPIILPFQPAEPDGCGGLGGKYADIGQKTIRIDSPHPLGEPTKKAPVPYRRPPKG